MVRALLYICFISFFCCSAIISVTPTLYAAATSAPSTGLEGGQRHSYGPESENKYEKKVNNGAMKDAYGNPILPDMEEDAPRQRLRSGAYGNAPERPSRPLPNLPETDAGWNF